MNITTFYPDGGRYRFAYFTKEGKVISKPVVGWRHEQGDQVMDPMVLGDCTVVQYEEDDKIPLGLYERDEDPNIRFADQIADLERQQMDEESKQ